MRSISLAEYGFSVWSVVAVIEASFICN